MTSDIVSFSAQEILHSLEELDEETNLSFNSKSNNNNTKKTLSLEESSSVSDVESESESSIQETTNNYNYSSIFESNSCNASVNSYNNDAITVQISNTRSSQLKKQVASFRSNSLARSLSRLSKSSALAQSTPSKPKLNGKPKLKDIIKTSNKTGNSNNINSSSSNSNRDKAKSSSLNEASSKKHSSSLNQTSSKTKSSTQKKVITISRSPMKSVDSNKNTPKRVTVPKKHIDSQEASSAKAKADITEGKVAIEITKAITDVQSQELSESNEPNLTNPTTSNISTSTSTIATATSSPPSPSIHNTAKSSPSPTPTSSPSPSPTPEANPNNNVTNLVHTPAKSTKSYQSDDITNVTSPTASLTVTSSSSTSFASPKRTIRCTALLSQTSSPLSSSFQDKGNVLIDDDDDIEYDYEDYNNCGYNDHDGECVFGTIFASRESASSPTLFEYDKYDIPTNNDSADDKDDYDDENGLKNDKGKTIMKSVSQSKLYPKQKSTDNGIQKKSATSNPTGMVISTSELCYAREAILDPTWLDSVDDDKDIDDANHKNEESQAVDTKLMSKLLNAKSVNHPSSTSTTTSNSSKYLSGDSISDNNSVSSKSISLASSLSVGSCGFGRISLGGSGCISLGSDVDDGSNSELSYADVVDMGVTSVKDAITDARSARSRSSNASSSYGSSQGCIIDRLYDMDKIGYFGSDSESEMSGDDLDSDSNSHRQKHLSEAPALDVKDKHHEDETKAYLPSSYIVTPPRVIRHIDQESSLPKPQLEEQTSDQEDSSIKVVQGGVKVRNPTINDDEDRMVDKNSIPENEFDIIDPVIEIPSRDATPDEASIASSTPADTNQRSNTSVSKPFSLDHEGLAGIVQGDIMISILDCPGKRTRRKRGTRSRIGMRRTKFNSAFAGEFNWCEHSVELSVHMIRKLRISESYAGDNLTYDEFCKSTLSPLELGRSLVSCKSPTRNRVLSNNDARSPFSSSNGSDSKKGQNRCERLETAAIHNLEVSIYIRVHHSLY